LALLKRFHWQKQLCGDSFAIFVEEPIYSLTKKLHQVKKIKTHMNKTYLSDNQAPSKSLKNKSLIPS
jgi:hypothetical protein